MIKKINIFGLCAAFLVSVTLLTGCSDQFLKDKENYNQTTEFVYNDYAGAMKRVDNLYALLMPSGTAGIDYQFPSTGSADIYSKSTEEYGGFTDLIDPNIVIDNTNVQDLFFNERKTSRNPYGRIRNCNDIIEGVTKGTLTDEEKGRLLGQAYFFRAWCYLRLVKAYGGVPIVDKFQNVIVGEDEGLSLVVPRSTAKECIEFIVNDLKLAAEGLPDKWDADNFARVTSGAALALQGRALLLYASPVFNRADDVERWKDAYQSNKSAVERLEAGDFGLANIENPGINGAGWGSMLVKGYGNPEAVLVTLHNNIRDQGGATNPYKNNAWEQSIRPTNTKGSGGKVPSGTMVDLFPMADGKKPGLSTYAYDPNVFMLNRDPRFYRTFAFTGVRWSFSGNPTSSGIVSFPYSGDNYQLWNYAWYNNKENLGKNNSSGYGADGLGDNYKGIYVRKRTDDADLNSTPFYKYDNETTNPFGASAAPYIEIRFAEVLLNLAESACGAGEYTVALNALKKIRERVGYKEVDNYGLPTDIAGDRAKLFEAILYERQIELAYEGKRYDDMHRWMLWDGGTGVIPGQPNTWNLTGFNKNTCAYLGVKPLNGTKRIGLELRVADEVPGYIGDPKPEKDPLKESRPSAWDLGKTKDPSVALLDFYTTKLKRKDRAVDPTDERVITFEPKFYFIGLKENAQRNNITLKQTIGWHDQQTNAPGTFDPLAE